MGYYGEKGLIYIGDRNKDIIMSGGENISIREVEEILYRHSAVLEAAVVGVPDDVWVDRVHAMIVLKEGCHATGNEIIEY
jgi:acyl-CoA synthetase (AMP-forming)/AMP-acid ligase II